MEVNWVATQAALLAHVDKFYPKDRLGSLRHVDNHLATHQWIIPSLSTNNNVSR
jgi:hypothetical protein